MLDQWIVMKNPNITLMSLESLQTIGIHALTQMVTTSGTHVIPPASLRLTTPLEIKAKHKRALNGIIQYLTQHITEAMPPAAKTTPMQIPLPQKDP